jgi:hypothetical protein
MSEDQTKESSWKAPYLSYETFANFFDRKLAGQPVPSRIDTHFLDNYAGSVRPQIIATLKTMNLIGETGTSLDGLRRASADPDSRREIFRDWAEGFYRDQIALADEAATASMLWETFSRHGYSGSTLRKAVVFYLALASDLDLPVSPHFKPPKATPAATSTRQKRGQPKTPAVESEPTVQTAGTGSGETKVIDFGTSGKVTIQVDVKWLELPEDTFVGLRRAIREIESFGNTEALMVDGDSTVLETPTEKGTTPP